MSLPGLNPTRGYEVSPVLYCMQLVRNKIRTGEIKGAVVEPVVFWTVFGITITSLGYLSVFPLQIYYQSALMSGFCSLISLFNHSPIHWRYITLFVIVFPTLERSSDLSTLDGLIFRWLTMYLVLFLGVPKLFHLSSSCICQILLVPVLILE